jgi:hypothetical protein
MKPAPFDALPRTPAAHFKLCCFAAVAHVCAQVAESFGTLEDALEQFPFLAGYAAEWDGHVPAELEGPELDRWWRDALAAWEAGARTHLPLRALREAYRLEHDALTLLVACGLIEEDARFGLLFEAMQGAAQRRPTVGLLSAWWRAVEDCAEVRAYLRRLQALGLVRFVQADGPRAEWALEVPCALWDALRGEAQTAPAPWAHYRPLAELQELDALVLPAELKAQLAQLPALLKGRAADAFVVRGPRHNGRRTLAGAIARELSLGLLELKHLNAADDERWRVVGALAVALGALPCVALDVAPGEAFELPALEGCTLPLAVVLGKQGACTGPPLARALTFTLDLPEPPARRTLWEKWLRADDESKPPKTAKQLSSIKQPAVEQPASPALRGAAVEADADELEEISARFRLTTGNIRRAAELARAHAGLAGRARVTCADVRRACRTLHRQALDTLAVRVETCGDWSHLSVSQETFAELRNLESRCRNRERLPGQVGRMLGGQLNRGVRALFSGVSGTGKTLAARLLAAALRLDLYRLDLSTVVNKYIGETEKNLNRVFALAEELDVILLLDEGDALLTQRTDVSNANDRYANLETNYLLQRLECFEGILLVTTNASDRIDGAFQRRMDVVINFAPPAVAERFHIWQMHLPAAHAIEQWLLDEVVQRCELAGGQIRNAVLHATALALADGGAVTGAHLEAAVRREYRKSGGVCPLPARRLAAVASADRW